MKRATGSILSDYGISVSEVLELPGNTYHDNAASEKQ